MRTIRNTTRLPLRIPLRGGKVLHLGPAKTGQVADDAVERGALRKMLESGAVEIVGEGAATAQTGEKPAARTGSTRGHQPTTVILPKGDR